MIFQVFILINDLHSVPTSYLLSGIPESLLKRNFSKWERSKWIDDSLLTHFSSIKDNIVIGGIMIWGRSNTTAQWIDPFHFEMTLTDDKTGYKEFSFMFQDRSAGEISYEAYAENRSYWEQKENAWKYVIRSRDSYL